MQLSPLFDDIEQVKSGQPSTRLKWQDFPSFAQIDFTCCCQFLACYDGNQATFNAYRRELERLCHWAWQVAKKSLRELKRDDIEAFIYFCQRPRETWISTQQAPRFITVEGQRQANPQWRPFVCQISKKDRLSGKQVDKSAYTMSQSAVQAVFAVLSSFYNYLLLEDKVNANPVAQIRQKSKYFRSQQQQAPVRRLSEMQWHYVISSAEQLAQADPSKHERTLFIMAALYGMYLRISELTASSRWSPTMGDFFRDQDGNWWFTTVGKGNKQRQISVSNDMLDALKRYRRSLGLSELPSPGESVPLIQKFRGTGPVTDTRHIRRIVQQCFDHSIARLNADNLAEEAELLSAATVHWLRHTGISDDVKHRPREHVRDDAGHGSSAITDRYIDIELRARHASAKHKKLRED